MKEFRDLLRRYVISSPTIQKAIKDRFYPTYLAEIKNPTFPCVNFAVVTGGSVDTNVKDIARLVFRVWVWSKKSLEEAYTIYKAIFDLLHRVRLESQSIYCVSEETDRPFDNYDDVSGCYFLVATWSANAMEKS